MYENYAKLRDEHGMKDVDVAKATGISPSVMSDWKKGKYQLKYEKLAKIADLFGVSTDVLTGVQKMGQQDAYYINSETAAIAQQIYENPYMRILFDAAQESEPENLQMAAEILKRLKRTNRDE